MSNDPRAADVSFLPEDYVAKKSEARANLLCLSLFGVVMFGVVAAFFVTNRQWLGVRAEQRAINALYVDEAEKIDQLKMLEEQKTEMLRKAEITTALIEKIPRSVLVAEIVNRMPQRVTLETFELESKRINTPSPSASPLGKPKPRVHTMTGSGNEGAAAEKAPVVKPPQFEYTLTLTGVAASNTEITNYVTNLGTSTLLEDVELNFIKETVKNEVALREFEITAQLREGADARSIEVTEVLTLDKGGAPKDREQAHVPED